MWFFVEWTLVILGIIFIFSQIIIPGFSSNLQFFWIFKSNNKRIEEIKDKHIEAIQEEIILDQEKLVNKLYSEIETKKKEK